MHGTAATPPAELALLPTVTVAIEFRRKGERPDPEISSRCVARSTGKRVVAIDVADEWFGFEEKHTNRAVVRLPVEA